MPRVVIVPLKPGSDGDYLHRPPPASSHTIIDPPTLYLERIGQQWMQDRGEAVPGVKYILDRLPHGYALYQRPRASGIMDKYLFGHPDHKYFDSPNRFYPHFKHLMENNGNRIGCPCTVCDRRGGVLPKQPGSTSGFFNKSHSKGNSSSGSSRKSSGASSKKPALPLKPAATATATASSALPHQLKGRPKMVLTGMDTSRVDEEGTPDVYRNLIDRLKRHDTLDEAIMEPMSLDWRAEQEIIPGLLKKLKCDPQWLPRAGDIVLYIRNMPEDLEVAQHPQTGLYQFYNAQDDTFLKAPVWEAGLVGQPPAAAPDKNTIDGEEWGVGYSGVRVEPLPDPNDDKKFLSKRHKYVPVDHTRPFFLWDEYLSGTPEEDWHPTIRNAFTVAATISLMGKHRFRGLWPNAQIYCHAIYVGAELLAVGDTVRLTPNPKAGEGVCTDVLVIKSIRLKFSNLDKASANDWDEGRPYNSEVWIFGSGYTLNQSRSSKEWLNPDDVEVPKAAAGYLDWHPLHPPNKELAVPFSRVIGRLYEQEAMRVWLTDTAPDLDQGREGLLEARKFATKHDKRISSSFGASWFWADNRAAALDLQTVNGLEVGNHDTERDPKEWRKKIKVMENRTSEQTGKPAIPEHRRLRAFMAPGSTTALPVRTQNRRDEGSSGSSPSLGSKRSNVIDVSDDEDDEEEIRRQTRVLTEFPSTKKQRVMVVVD